MVVLIALYSIKKDISNKLKNKKGLTLVEIILSLAIVGIIAVSIIPLFGTSIKGIARSGKRTSDIVTLQDNMVENIRKSEDGITDVTKVATPISPVEVHIPGVTTNGPLEVKGDLLEVIGEKDESVKIQTFIPGKD